MKTVEELKMPRYKVIADYPNSPFSIGSVYSYDVVDEELINIQAKPTFHTIHDIERYPHLFKKLEWFEERKIEDMPPFVKNELSVEKVVRWHSDTMGTSFFLDCYSSSVCPSGYTPATLFEYTTYISQTKP